MTATRGEAASPAFSRRIPLIVAAAFFMEALDGTIITTALPAMARSLGESTLEMTASITVYLVAMTVFVPTAGWTARRFGARDVFAGAVAMFTLASLLCALSPTSWTLIAARCLQGVAAAFMSPVGRLIVLHEAPKHHIIRAIGLVVWPGLIAPVIGPPLGGLITTYLAWQWIFLINLPIGILGVWLILRFVPRHAAEPAMSFDGFGFVATAGSLALFIYGMSLLAEGSARMVIGSWCVVVGLVAGVVAVRHSLRHPRPMLDLGAARVPTFTLSTLSAGFVARAAIGMTPFLLPLMFQIGFHYTPFAAGMMLLVYMAGNLAMKTVTTQVLERFGFRTVVTLNGVLCAATLAGCGWLAPATPAWIIYGVLFVAGMTRSMNFTAMATLAFADVPDGMRAGATTLASMAQQGSNTIGIALAALLLGVFLAARHGAALDLADFQHTFIVSAIAMAVATAWSLRLAPDAGDELARKR